MVSVKLSESKVIELISLVRDHPCLYDHKMHEHRNSEIIHSTWEGIADEIGVEYFGGKC